MKRRSLLIGTGAALAAGAGGIAWQKTRTPGLQRLARRVPLQMPPVLDARKTRQFALEARAGSASFVPGIASQTLGFNQAYLGPVVRANAKGTTRAGITNTLSFPVTVHWHGLIVPGEQDGGPHQLVNPGANWTPDLAIDQPPAMVWYHSHVHGRTAQQVYAGLAGVLILDDGKDEERGLPVTWGIDDLVMVVQDKHFDYAGKLSYAKSPHDRMTGFVGGTMLVNGQIDPVASVPKSIVRLRLLNASNAGVHVLRFADGRPMHIVATDSGYLDKPVAVTSLRMAPAERFQVLVDFSNGGEALMISEPEAVVAGNGFMGTMMRTRSALSQFARGATALIAFRPEDSLAAPVRTLPATLDGGVAAPGGTIARTRQFQLQTGMGMMGGRMMGGGMMGGGMAGGGMMGAMTINGSAFDMKKVNETVAINTFEKWVIRADVLFHPFHIHGVRFRVLSESGGKPRIENQGWKDTVLVRDVTELLVEFTRPAAPEKPFMYHCHILEHEDAGMMGQFSVV